MKKCGLFSVNCLVLCFGVSASVHAMNQNCMKALSLEGRKEIAKKILLMANIESSTKLFAQENEETCTWFEGHKKELQNFLQQEVSNDIKVDIMGSRRWKTNHTLSDIDAVVITKSTEYEGIIFALKKYYEEHYKDISQFSTKTSAGLYLFILKNFTDEKLGDVKLEYTIQTPEINQTIISGMQERISERFKSIHEKTSYALEMLKAVYENDKNKQAQLKEWTRILPKK